MASPTPIVRQVVLCERIAFDFAIGYSLINPRVEFILRPGKTFPTRLPEAWVFIQLTGSFGTHRFRIELVDVTDPTAPPVRVFRTDERAVNLGDSAGEYRLRSRSWASKLRRLPFPHPGRYELWVTFDSIPQGRIELLVEGGS